MNLAAGGRPSAGPAVMVQKLSFSVAAGDRGLRLDQFLAREMPRRLGAAISRRRIRRLIADGAVYVEDRRTRIASRSVERGRRIDVFVDSGTPIALPSGPVPNPRPEIDVERLLLYEDEHLLALDKPSGIAVQANVDDDAHHLLARAGDFLSRRLGRRPPYLALPHRLDRGTSGVQLLAKSRLAAAALSAAFRERRVDKEYLALCAAGDEPLADEWVVHDRLVFRQGPGQSRRAVSVSGGGRPAETRFEVKERMPGGVLIAASPKTGRTHQIRVHLAGSGAAVLGDPIYGSPPGSGAVPRLMLHAAALRLRHPIHGGPFYLESPLPGDFQRMLDALRSE
ncbi:MAG: RluA family pseudouridine synthase [Thermoanaerobaculia bacterium]